ncbi:hypothetical protein B0H12DRAFT_1023434 [Mycena haematopus]|nr:hypothetical protein B0H12DRAFT_1023434 [Mycena haematopus]
MLGSLNLYLDTELSYTWRQASLVVSRSQGHGIHHARNIRTWLHAFLSKGTLPFHRLGAFRATVLDDEDFSLPIQLHLQSIAKEGEGYIRAQDIVDFIADTPEMQAMMEKSGAKRNLISLRTAQRWLHKMGWRFGKKKNGMYIDGHERSDVVEYREGFVARWREYDKRMNIYDNDGNLELGPQRNTPPGTVPFLPDGHAFKLILVTHDESTFFQNDCKKNCWIHKTDKPTPQRKGEGQSIMVSDFLTTEWGRLMDEDEYVEARLIFKAGKDRDSYFDNDHVIIQVEKAINIFERKCHKWATGLFLFDNAPTHQRRAADALSARKMPKRPSENWRHHKDGLRMRDGILLDDGSSQPFYFPDDHPNMPGWFKVQKIQFILQSMLTKFQGHGANHQGTESLAGHRA